MPSFQSSEGSAHWPRARAASRRDSRRRHPLYGRPEGNTGLDTLPYDILSVLGGDYEFGIYGISTQASYNVEEHMPERPERVDHLAFERPIPRNLRSPSPPLRRTRSRSASSASSRSNRGRFRSSHYAHRITRRSPTPTTFSRSQRATCRSPSPMRCPGSPSPTQVHRRFGEGARRSPSSERNFRGSYSTGTTSSRSSRGVFGFTSTFRSTRRSPSPPRNQLSPSPPRRKQSYSGSRRRRSPSMTRRRRSSTPPRRHRSPSQPSRHKGRAREAEVNNGRNSQTTTFGSTSRSKSRSRLGRMFFFTRETKPEGASGRSQSESGRGSNRHSQDTEQPCRANTHRARADSARPNRRRAQRARSPSPPRFFPRHEGTSGRQDDRRTEERGPDCASSKPSADKFSAADQTYTNSQSSQRKCETEAPGSNASSAPTHPQMDMKKMFEVYDIRWEALSRTDPKYPLPAAMSDLSTLDFASGSSSKTTSFTAEEVMIANVQLIFLAGFGVFGILKRHSDGLKVEVPSWEMKRENAKSLVKWLKRKEQPRWHPDRMNLRTGVSGKIDERVSKKADVVAMRTAAQTLIETLDD